MSHKHADPNNHKMGEHPHVHVKRKEVDKEDENPSNHMEAIDKMTKVLVALSEKKELPGSKESTLSSEEDLKRYYARFGRNMTALECQIILFRYLKCSDFDVDEAVEHLLKTAEFRRKQNVDYMAVFTSLIPLQGYNEAVICEKLGLPRVKVITEGTGTSQSPMSDPLGPSSRNPSETFYTNNYADYYEDARQQQQQQQRQQPSEPSDQGEGEEDEREKDGPKHVKIKQKRSTDTVHKSKSKNGAKGNDRWFLGRLKDKVFPHGLFFKKEPQGSQHALDDEEDKESASDAETPNDVNDMSLTHIPDDHEPDLESSMMLDTTAAARPITDSATLQVDSESLNFHTLLEPIVRTILARIPITFHYWDKEGHPVMYVRLHLLSSKRFSKELFKLAPLGTDIKALLSLFAVYLVEVMQQLIRFNNLKNMQQNVVREAFISESIRKEERILPKKNLITTATIVIDCKGLRIKRFAYKPLLARFLSVIAMVQRHYPETVRHIYVVNCQPIFTLTYLSMRKSIKETTREKITFCNKSKTTETLKRTIDSELLPIEYGGRCHCMGGCCHVVYRPEGDSGSSEGSTAVSDYTGSLYTTSANLSHRRSGQMKTTVRLLHVSPRKHRSISFAMDDHEELVWEFTVRKKRPIDFSVLFIPADGSEIVHIHKNAEMRDGASHYICPAVGTLLIKWNNRRNKVHKAHIHVKIYHEGNEI